MIFFDESKRIENDSATDDAGYFRLKNSGWDEMQNVPVVTETDGMAGIVSALITGDTVEFLDRKSVV